MPPDGDVLPVNDADGFPEQGFLLVDGELIYYASRTANAFTNLTRGMLQDLGYLSAERHTLLADRLVLDYRAVLACTWPFDERVGGGRRQRLPYRSVAELASIETAGFGAFSVEQLDRLAARTTAAGSHADSPDWGRGERVFNNLQPPVEGERPGTRRLRVRSGFHFGAGSTVRIRNLQTGELEYGLVIDAQPGGVSDSTINLPAAWILRLLKPVTRAYPAIDTVVEPLVPRPININTAEEEVLVAVMRELRGARFQRLREGEQHVPAPRITRAEAGGAGAAHRRAARRATVRFVRGPRAAADRPVAGGLEPRAEDPRLAALPQPAGRPRQRARHGHGADVVSPREARSATGRRPPTSAAAWRAAPRRAPSVAALRWRCRGTRST